MLALIVFLFGLAVGSFLNVVIIRLRVGDGLGGRSRCPRCSQQLAWYDNIPLLSFIVLGGRCRSCRAPISWQYPLVELASGLLWLTGYLVMARSLSHAVGFEIASPRLISGLAMTSGGEWLAVLAFGIFASTLLTLFIFDLRWYVLPDIVTLPGIVVALAFNLVLGRDWRWIIGAAIIGALWFGWQYLVSRGRWVGSGDIRLGALVGAMVASWQGLLVTLLLAYVVGSLVGLVLVALGRKSLKGQLPFGTFVAVATVVVLVWGEAIWQWYWGVLGW